MPKPLGREKFRAVSLELCPTRRPADEGPDHSRFVKDEVLPEPSSTAGRLLKWFSTGVEIADKEDIKEVMTSGDPDNAASSSSILSGYRSIFNIMGAGRLRPADCAVVVDGSGIGGVDEARKLSIMRRDQDEN